MDASPIRSRRERVLTASAAEGRPVTVTVNEGGQLDAIVVALVVMVVMVGLAVSAHSLAPRWLSWPQRVRWMVAAQHLEVLCGPGPLSMLLLREVVVVRVDPGSHGDELLLEVADVALGTTGPLALVSHRAVPDDLVAMLCEWCLLRTPMVLYETGDGAATLTGPVASIGDLRLVARGSGVPARQGRVRPSSR
jgi:hypothetical protein